MLGIDPVSDMPICATSEYTRSGDLLVFVQSADYLIETNRIVSDSLVFTQSADGYTNHFTAANTLHFTQSVIVNSPVARAASSVLTFHQQAYVLWKPLAQTVNHSLTFTQSAEHNLKIGIASNTLEFTQSATHNQVNVVGSNRLYFQQSAAVKGPIYAVAGNQLFFNQYLKSTPLYLEASNTLVFSQELKRQMIMERVACSCLYFASQVRKVIEVDAENELTFVSGMDEFVADNHLVFTQSVTCNLIDEECCSSAYLPDKTAENVLTFVQSATYVVVWRRTAESELNFYGAVVGLIP